MKPEAVNFPVTLPANWQAPTGEDLSQLPAVLKDWLLDKGSLTARLKSKSIDFQVKVVGERQEQCSEAEACDFIQAGEQVLVREVLLYCDNVPQVFARSLLPLTSLTGQEQSLANLGEQPLGQVLFNNPSLKRERLELTCFSSDSRVAKLAKSLGSGVSKDDSCHQELWGRRSIFILKNKPLMVAEVYLPGAFAYQECDTE